MVPKNPNWKHTTCKSYHCILSSHPSASPDKVMPPGTSHVVSNRWRVKPRQHATAKHPWSPKQLLMKFLFIGFFSRQAVVMEGMPRAALISRLRQSHSASQYGTVCFFKILAPCILILVFLCAAPHFDWLTKTILYCTLSTTEKVCARVDSNNSLYYMINNIRFRFVKSYKFLNEALWNYISCKL